MTRDELMDEGFEKALTFEDKYLQPKACFQYGYVAGAEPREKRIAELEAQIEKMKRCEICKEYTSGSCNYHSYSQQVCKENGMKLFKLKEIKENGK